MTGLQRIFLLTEQISEYIRKGEIMANEYPNIFGEGWMTERIFKYIFGNKKYTKRILEYILY